MNLRTIMYDDIFLSILLFINIAAMYSYMEKGKFVKISTAIFATATIRAVCSYVTNNPLRLFHFVVLLFTIITIIFRGLLLVAYLIEHIEHANKRFKNHIFVLACIVLLFLLLEILKHSKLCLIIYKGGCN